MRYRRTGFTLVEMLLVVGIMILLAGIIVPTINRARLSAARAKMASDLSALATALEAYKADHGDYPRMPNVATVDALKGGYDHAVLLCQALVAPADDDDMDADTTPAVGFRTRAGGKVYGPYLPDGTFKLEPAVPLPPGYSGPREPYLAFIDDFGKPVLYYPARPGKANVRTASPAVPRPYTDVTGQATYDPRPGHTGVISPRSFAVMLGDTNDTGVIESGETPVEADYLLWSAGPDELFGPNLGALAPFAPTPPPALTAAEEPVTRDAVQQCDDVTNFRR